MTPQKNSVALLVRNGDKLPAIRRRDAADELPGIWGLPAGSLRAGETIEEVIRRIGGDKLGVMLHPIRKIAAGGQNRSTYRLEMELWEATMEGTPTYPQWQWAAVDLLRPGAAAGSLCCDLAIQAKSRVS